MLFTDQYCVVLGIARRPASKLPAIALMAIAFCLSTLNAPVLAQGSVASDADTASSKIKVLLITGGCCHDYQNQKKLIRDGLSKTHRNLDWTILEYGSERDLKVDVYQSKDWIGDYDLVIHNECYGGVEDSEFVKGIVNGHVSSGIPAMVIHCSMHSYRNSPAADHWRSLLGVTSRRHERLKRSLRVEATKGGVAFGFDSILGDGWDTPNGELYIIEKVWPETDVLATAYSNETMKPEPVVWLNRHEGVKVFGISLGHHNETIESEAWQRMVSKGFDWCVQP
ncbi:MAG: ThuA domain-containing protein [Rubripirellula sp.]|nr:ThuA domain-containing protein [Rubripirellula sp.]